MTVGQHYSRELHAQRGHPRQCRGRCRSGAAPAPQEAASQRCRGYPVLVNQHCASRPHGVGPLHAPLGRRGVRLQPRPLPHGGADGLAWSKPVQRSQHPPSRCSRRAGPAPCRLQILLVHDNGEPKPIRRPSRRSTEATGLRFRRRPRPRAGLQTGRREHPRSGTGPTARLTRRWPRPQQLATPIPASTRQGAPRVAGTSRWTRKTVLMATSHASAWARPQCG